MRSSKKPANPRIEYRQTISQEQHTMNESTIDPIIFSGYSKEYLFVENNYENNTILEKHAEGQISELIGLLVAPVSVMLESRLWGSTILPGIVSTNILKKEELTIIDFGGGAGKQFVEITRAIDQPSLVGKIRYHLIEMPKLCSLIEPKLKEIFEPIWNNLFHLSSSVNVKHSDIVSCTSSLQYIENYAEQIEDLLATRPEFFLIINTPVNNKYTYCRYQHNLAVKISQWVFGLNELDTIFEGNGYARVFFAAHEQNHMTLDTPSDSGTLQGSLIYQKIIRQETTNQIS